MLECGRGVVGLTGCSDLLTAGLWFCDAGFAGFGSGFLDSGFC